MTEFVAAEGGLRLGRQRVLFVGGKGGVGKTTTAASLALALAERGERTLLVSTDPAHSLGDLFDRPIGDKEIALAPNLTAREIDAESQVEQHLKIVRDTMRDMVKRELYPQIDSQIALARLSPGAIEAAMLERISELMIGSARKYDRLIFDTAPTGHTLRLLSLPEIMTAWTDGLLGHRDRSEAWNDVLKDLRPRTAGAEAETAVEREDERSSRIRSVLLERRAKFQEARQILLDPQLCGFILVLLPERLPILESQKAVESLSAFDVPILGLIVNRVLPRDALGTFLEQRRQQESAYLEQIDRDFAGLPRLYLPFFPHDVEGLEALRSIGRALLSTASSQ